MEKEELIIKGMFTLTILITLFVLVSGTLTYGMTKEYNPFEIATKNITSQRFSEMKYVFIEPFHYADEESVIQTPVNSGNKTIILRMDDIAAHQYRGTSEKLIQDILDKNMAITIAVIPNRVYQLHEDEELVSWLNERKNNPNFEIALHGNEHLAEEFKTMTYEEAYESISEGNKEILTTLGMVPITFIPPSNEYSWDTVEASKDLGFKVFSAKEGEYFISKERDFLSLGFTSKTYEFDKVRFVPVDEVIDDCRKSLDEKDYCVVMIHPQDYLQKDDSGKFLIVNEFEPYRYREYQRMLDELDKLSKEQNAEFKTFSDLVVEE